MVFVPDAEAVTAVQTVPVASDGFATVFSAAADRAFKGGVAGFSAGVLQVRATKVAEYDLLTQPCLSLSWCK